MQGLQDTLANLGQYMTSDVVTLLKAIAVLIIGCLAAWIISALVRRALMKTELDDRIAAWVTGGKKEQKVDVEMWVSRALFWLLMLFVLVAFFQVLGLSGVTQPLNAFLEEIFAYLPRLIGPAILALIAFFVATGLRWVVRTALQAANVDERFTAQAEGKVEGEAKKPIPLSQTLSEAVFWLILLLFLPAILGGLGLEGLLRPVQNLVDDLLGFLPNLLGAALILAIGWFVARIIQRVVTGLLSAVGVDRFSAQLGVDKALGEQRLSGLLGTIVYVLILIPVLIAALEKLAIESITRPASEMLNSMLQALPNIFAAGLVIALAYLVGRIVSGLVSNVLTASGFDSLPQRLGLVKGEWKAARSPSDWVGTLVLLVILLFAATEAADLLGFEAISVVITQFTEFGGQIILGIIILGVGLFLANLAYRTIQASSATEAHLLALAAKIAIIILSGAMALRRMGLANEIINLAFGLTLGAVAVAIALAFGLGAREVAARQVEKWRQSVKKKSE